MIDQLEPSDVRASLEGIGALTSRDYVDDRELSKFSLALAHIYYEAIELQRAIRRIVQDPRDETYLAGEADIRASLNEIVTHALESKALRDVVVFAEDPSAE